MNPLDNQQNNQYWKQLLVAALLFGISAHFNQSGQRSPLRGGPVCSGYTQRSGSSCSGTCIQNGRTRKATHSSAPVSGLDYQRGERGFSFADCRTVHWSRTLLGILTSAYVVVFFINIRKRRAQPPRRETHDHDVLRHNITIYLQKTHDSKN